MPVEPDTKLGAPRAPQTILWIRCNSIAAILTGCITAPLVMTSLVPAGMGSIVIGLTAVVWVLALLGYGVPAWSPRTRLALRWGWGVHVLQLLTCWTTIPALVVLYALSKTETRDWYSVGIAAEPDETARSRYGVAAFICLYWLFVFVVFVFAAYDAYQGQPRFRLNDGETKYGMVSTSADTTRTEVGLPIELAGVTPDGAPWSLADVGEGAKVIVVWATWCPDCDREMPALKLLGSDCQTCVAAALDCEKEEDGADNRAVVMSKVEAAGLRWPTVCVDPRASAVEEVYEIPTAFVLDGENRVRYTAIGDLKPLALKDAVQTLSQR